MWQFRALIFGLLVAAACLPARAQPVQSIAAIVNDDVVSMFDLRSRVRLVIASGKLADSIELRQRLEPQVLRTLIDEKLQIQEAKRRNVTVSESEIQSAIEGVEKQNSMPAGGLKRFLESNGVPIETFQQQVTASLVWAKVVNRQFRPTLAIGNDEVDEALDRFKKAQGQIEYRLSEIFLAMDSPEDEARVRTNAERMVGQIRNGASFDALARQFSQGASGSAGGQLGWMREDQIDEVLRVPLSQMREGETSAPVAALDGFRILRLEGKRQSVAATADDAMLTLGQVLLPVPKDASPQDLNSQHARAASVRQALNGCADLPKLKAELSSPRPVSLGTFALKDLSPDIRSAVTALDVGKTSQPLKMPDGFLLLTVCERKEPKSAVPDRDEVERSLLRQRLEMMSRRYLRDVRMSAVVDLRV